MVESIAWIDPDGASTSLHTTATHFVAWNVSGRFAPPAMFDEEGVPEQDGARLYDVLHGVRDFSLPVWIQGATESDLRTSLRSLAAAMNPKRGDGIVRITSPLGDQREIVCRVASGLEIVEKIGDTSGLTAQLAPIVFRAFSPYWRDPADTLSTWTSGSSPGTFLGPAFFPLRLSSSEIFSMDSVVNAGDVTTWPVWTITGPAADIVLRNETTGRHLELEVPISIGEVLTIDTRPGLEAVTTTFGNNLWPLLTLTSSLWDLPSGSSQVRIEMGDTDGDTEVILARRHHYLTV